MPVINLIKNKAAPSFCTSNQEVLKMIILYCKRKNLPCLIESTSNQVNQYGGYSGKTPRKFYKDIKKILKKNNFNLKNFYIGGDHLGPLPWKNKNEKEAIKNSVNLINKCLDSNYTKIHIDTSIKCLSDKTINHSIIFDRTKFILDKSKLKNNLKKIFLIIGTEVPLSGSNEKGKIKITQGEQINLEVKKFKDLLNKLYKGKLKFGLVVEPGMRFMHNNILKPNLSNFKKQKKISKSKNFVFEAHSTDYQPLNILQNLVRNNFKFLKVGPELTYNYARSLFFMEKIEKKYNRGDISEIKKNILHYMLNNKKYWKDYYTGKKSKVKNLILNSKLDRMRYYLNQKKIILSINKLRKNINRLNIAKIKKHLFQKENKIFFKSQLAKNLTNFELINLIFISKSLNRYYKACGYKV